MIFTFDTQAAFVAIAVSAGATVAWAALLIQSVLAFYEAREQRHRQLTMPIVGLLASIGTLASAVGFADQLGVIDTQISHAFMSLVASVGRGALFMGALLALASYRPPRRK